MTERMSLEYTAVQVVRREGRQWVVEDARGRRGVVRQDQLSPTKLVKTRVFDRAVLRLARKNTRSSPVSIRVSGRTGSSVSAKLLVSVDHNRQVVACDVWIPLASTAPTDDPSVVLVDGDELNALVEALLRQFHPLPAFVYSWEYLYGSERSAGTGASYP